MKKEIILKGNEFVLRHIKISDTQRYFECFQGKSIKQALLKIPKNINEMKKELKSKILEYKKKKPFGETFAIEVDGEFAGYVELHDLNIEYTEHKGEIGYASVSSGIVTFEGDGTWRKVYSKNTFIPDMAFRGRGRFEGGSTHFGFEPYPCCSGRDIIYASGMYTMNDSGGHCLIRFNAD